MPSPLCKDAPLPGAAALPARLLLVCLDESRASRIQLALIVSGITVESRRVTQAATLGQALRESEWDVVVCDFDFPGLSGLVALRIVRETAGDLPFVFVSSVLGTGAAVAAIKAGADNYIADGELEQLAPAVQHEITRARERALRRQRQAPRGQARRPGWNAGGGTNPSNWTMNEHPRPAG